MFIYTTLNGINREKAYPGREPGSEHPLYFLKVDRQ